MEGGLMLPLDIDPNSVVAGWIPLVLILVLGGASALLFRSMRRQMRKIDIPEEGVDTRPDQDPEHVEQR
ncbi:hypothetical protein [Enemella evansiae]|nr:hypothetical protein [Enemella evansiae]